MTQIRMIDGHLDVPNTPTLPFIVGDGIGQDIWSSAQHVFDAAVKKVYNGERQVDWLKVLAGKEAFASRGMSLPAETIDAITEHLVAIKGPLETPVGEGIRSSMWRCVKNLICMHAFALYATSKVLKAL